MDELCFECNARAHVRHHVVPRSLGGTRTVFLCNDCHGKVHNREFTDARRLTKQALVKLKQEGARLGRPVTLPEEVRRRIGAERASGSSLRQIARGLIADNVPTARGGQWNAASVSAVLASLKLDDEADELLMASIEAERASTAKR